MSENKANQKQATKKQKQKQNPRQNQTQEHETHITNAYKNISTEERIRMYLKIYRYMALGEQL